MFDSKFQQEGSTEQPVTYDLPSSSSLHTTIETRLETTSDQARDIEKNTREQYLLPLWFSARRFHITAFLFGNVYSCRPDTSPDNLVLRIIQPKNFSTAATQYGLDTKETAVKAYVEHQFSHGHPEILVSSSGFMINPRFPFLGATPDRAVYDPYEPQHPVGFLVVKCPCSVRSVTPAEACSVSHFFVHLIPKGSYSLKKAIHIIVRFKARWQWASVNGVTLLSSLKKALVFSEYLSMKNFGITRLHD